MHHEQKTKLNLLLFTASAGVTDQARIEDLDCYCWGWDQLLGHAHARDFLFSFFVLCKQRISHLCMYLQGGEMHFLH